MSIFDIAILTSGRNKIEGTHACQQHVPSKTDGGQTIQVPYYNAFGSVWEYHRAFLAKKIDWHSVLAGGCPLCGDQGCWRDLTPYYRWVTDLLPFREERIAIARFFCRKTRTTFSLLPVQLVPYRRYTADSIVFCLLLAVARGEGMSLFAIAEKLVEPESKVSGYLLRSWIDPVVKGLRRARPVLGGRVCIQAREVGGTGRLAELSSTCRSFGIRGPPDFCGIRELDQVIQSYARVTGHFLFGAPSQERICRAAR